jgi:GNAT superfamily N-acetyltransferase
VPIHQLDGVEVRPLTCRDVDSVVEMVRGCSPDSLWQRFLGHSDPASALVGPLLHHAREQRIDLGAFRGGALLGLASLVAAADDLWEAALLVRDSHQGRGIGSLLTGSLEAWSRERGVDRISVVYLLGNRRVAALVRRQGRRTSGPVFDRGVVSQVVALDRRQVARNRLPHEQAVPDNCSPLSR